MPAHAAAHNLPQADAYADACQQFNHIVAQLRAPPTQLMTHSELEILLETQGRELLRRLLQAHLDERSPGQVATPWALTLANTLICACTPAISKPSSAQSNLLALAMAEAGA